MVDRGACASGPDYLGQKKAGVAPPNLKDVEESRWRRA